LEKQIKAAHGFLHIQNNQMNIISSENNQIELEVCAFVKHEDSITNKHNHISEKDLFSFKTNNNNNSNFNDNRNFIVEKKYSAYNLIQNNEDIQKLIINEKNKTAFDFTINGIEKADSNLTSDSHQKKSLFPENTNNDELQLLRSKKDITEEILKNPAMDKLFQLSIHKVKLEDVKNKILNECLLELITKPNPSALNRILQNVNHPYIYNNNYNDDNSAKYLAPYVKIDEDSSNNPFNNNFNSPYLLTEKNCKQHSSGYSNTQTNDIKIWNKNNLLIYENYDYNNYYDSYDYNNIGYLAAVSGYQRYILLNQFLQIKSLESQYDMLKKLY